MEFRKEDFSEAVRLWTEWNGKINVISRKDVDMLFEHHILHSLAIAEYSSRFDGIRAGDKVLDLGCGGGFPGIPLAMVMPDVEFLLCDSIGKKILVASEVARGLGLKNVSCVNARAENLGAEFDWVVSRAVTSLENFLPWVRGRYRKGILYLKGGDVNEEMARMCAKCRFKPQKLGAWPVSDWLSDDYFKEKFVIHVGK